MTTVSLADWGRHMDVGATTYAVGPVPVPVAVYLDRAEAEAAAEDLDGTYIEWTGHVGHQVAIDDLQSDAEPELEL